AVHGRQRRPEDRAGIGVAEAVPRHASSPLLGGVLDLRVMRQVVADGGGERLDNAQRALPLRIGEVHDDRAALPERGLLGLRQSGRVAAQWRGIDAQGLERAAWRNPEAVLRGLDNA